MLGIQPYADAFYQCYAQSQLRLGTVQRGTLAYRLKSKLPGATMDKVSVSLCEPITVFPLYIHA